MQLKRIKIKNNASVLMIRVALLTLFTLLCLVLSYRYINSTSGITILIHSHSGQNITSGKTTELLRGDKIKGSFQAKDNNIGIVSVRFNTFFRINSDSVIFRIKEKGARDWYYQQDYLVNQFQPNKYFTFGFPIISDSKEKQYVFEIESTIGEPGDAVALSPIEPVFVSKYQYSKQRVFSDKEYFFAFLYNKTINSLEDVNFLISLLVYLLPLILYIIKLFFFDKYFIDRYFFAFIPLVLAVVLCFVNVPRSDEAVIGVMGLWIVLSLTYRLKSSIPIICSLIFILFTPIFLYTNLVDLSRNTAMWGYTIFAVGIILQIIEVTWVRGNLRGFYEVFPELFSYKKKNTKK